MKEQTQSSSLDKTVQKTFIFQIRKSFFVNMLPPELLKWHSFTWLEFCKNINDINKSNLFAV